MFIVSRAFQRGPMSGEVMSEVRLKTVIEKLVAFAPPALAESWDNVGLLVEPVNSTMITHILLTNDLTEDVMEEALSVKTNLIISYHPPIFAPLKKFTSSSWKERIVAKCIANDIALFSPHTSWDVVKGGVNDWLVSAFQCKEVKPLVIQKNGSSSAYYIMKVIFYSDAGFKLIDKLETKLSPIEFKILNTRNETSGMSATKFTFRCSENALKIITSHLQEDLDTNYYVLPEHTVQNSVSGVGRVCKLVNPITIREAVDKLKKHIGMQFVQLALAHKVTPDDLVETIAFVAGSGGSILKNVKCDLKITGEASHHEVLDSIHDGSSVILTNHSNSERGFLHQFQKILTHELDNPNVKIEVSRRDADPLNVI